MDPFLVVLLGLAGLCIWAAIFFRWRAGVYALVVYTPFTGPVVAAFAPSPIGNLVRDALIVIPLYLAFFLTRRQSDRVALPFGFLAIVGCFAALIAINAIFALDISLGVTLLGAKIWLFYIPLVAVVSAFLSTRDDLVKLLRTFVVMGWIPCTVGLLMWVGAVSYDYKEAVEFVYGDFARRATQNFAAFQIGESRIYRIPGTFQFAAQYAMFCMFMIIPALMLGRLEGHGGWRIFSYVSLALFIAASLTSGSRGAFLHLPFLFAVLAILRFGFGRGANVLLMFALIVFGGIVVWQFDQSAIFDHLAQLAAANGKYFVIGGIAYAIEHAGAWGSGVGSGTVAARHLIADTEVLLVAIENFYAKAWMELGLLGFLLIISLFAYLALTGIHLAGRIRDGALRDVTLMIVGMVVFIAYISSRGWPLDQDPMAYYYWVMIGLMFKISWLPEAYAVPQRGRAGLRPFPRHSLARR